MFQCGFEKPTNKEEVKTTIHVDHKSKDSVWFTITDLDGNLLGETGLLRVFPAWHQTDLTIIIPDPMKRFVKCFFELLTQILVKVRKCKVQRVCVLHFQLAGSGGCFFLMKLYH